MIAPGHHIRPPDRVLIIKPSALGDVVTGLPVLRGLRRTFPDAHIAWLISDRCAPLLRDDSQLDEAVLFQRKELGRAWRSPSAARAAGRFLCGLRRGRFDWVIDLQGLLRSGIFAAATGARVRAGFADAREGAHAFYNERIRPNALHTVDRNIALARRIGIDARSEDMRLDISIAGRKFADTFCRIRNFRPGGFLICAPTTTWATKEYPIRHWRKVVEVLSHRLPVVLIAAPPQRTVCRQIAQGLRAGVIDLAGETTVDEMVALIAASAGVVCCDSAVKFIAPAVGVGCVVLIGPTRVAHTGPYLRGHAIVAPVPCQGCLQTRCGHITCMQAIEPPAVIAATEAMLNGRKT